MRTTSGGLTRRDLLLRSAAAGAVLAAPWFVPAAALGRGDRPAPSERITLGVIGVGPRCTYDLQVRIVIVIAPPAWRAAAGSPPSGWRR